MLLKMGYDNFTVLMGTLDTLSPAFFLSIKKSPRLFDILATFTGYVIVPIPVGTQLVILTRWLYFKMTGTYAAEVDIANEVHPYDYKLTLCYLKVFGPTYLIILKINIKKVGGKLTDETIMEIKIGDNVEKLDLIFQGGNLQTLTP